MKNVISLALLGVFASSVLYTAVRANAARGLVTLWIFHDEIAG
jgi:hypothetical protein